MVIDNRNSNIVLVLSVIISVLTAFCAILGFIDSALYDSAVSTGAFKMVYMAGTISQDMITIVSSAMTPVLVVLYLKNKDVRIFVSIIGLLGFYLYGYGTYVLSAMYTSVYIIYMIIFTLSIFGVVLGVSGFAEKDIQELCLPKWLRTASIIFLSLIVCLFVPLWISSMIPHIQSHTIPDFYAIYILDLCVVMPFFIAVTYMLIRNRKKAYILLGIALLKTLTLILSVLIGEISVPAQGTEVDVAMVAVYSFITLIGTFLFICYLLRMKHGASV